jgi:hypothetical protein
MIGVNDSRNPYDVTGYPKRKIMGAFDDIDTGLA